MLLAAAVGGTFWGGFADVLSKASVPTNSVEFGKAMAAVALVFIPQAAQWLVGRFSKKPADRLEQLHELLSRIEAQLPAAPAQPELAPVQDAI